MPGRAPPLGADGEALGDDDEARGEEALEVGLRLLGRGEGLDMALEPSALMCLNGATIGTDVPLKLTLSNPNGAPRTHIGRVADTSSVHERSSSHCALLGVSSATIGRC